MIKARKKIKYLGIVGAASVIMVVLLQMIVVPSTYSQTVIGTPITVGLLPLGVGVNTITNRIYVSNLNSDNVSVINGDTNAVIATIAVGDGPRGVGVNIVTNKIYAAHITSANVYVIFGSTSSSASPVTPISTPSDSNSK